MCVCVDNDDVRVVQAHMIERPGDSNVLRRLPRRVSHSLLSITSPPPPPLAGAPYDSSTSLFHRTVFARVYVQHSGDEKIGWRLHAGEQLHVGRIITVLDGDLVPSVAARDAVCKQLQGIATTVSFVDLTATTL